MWHAGTYIRDETNAETKKFVSNRKETPFPGISGGLWERTGLWLFSRNKEGIGLGQLVGGQRACPSEWGVIQQALADQWLTRAACLPLTKENLGITTWKPLFWARMDQEKMEKRIVLWPWPWVAVWSMTWVLVLLSHSFCEALDKSLYLRSLVHGKEMLVLIPTTLQEY